MRERPLRAPLLNDLPVPSHARALLQSSSSPQPRDTGVHLNANEGLHLDAHGNHVAPPRGVQEETALHVSRPPPEILERHRQQRQGAAHVLIPLLCLRLPPTVGIPPVPLCARAAHASIPIRVPRVTQANRSLAGVRGKQAGAVTAARVLLAARGGGGSCHGGRGLQLDFQHTDDASILRDLLPIAARAPLAARPAVPSITDACPLRVALAPVRAGAGRDGVRVRTHVRGRVDLGTRLIPEEALLHVQEVCLPSLHARRREGDPQQPLLQPLDRLREHRAIGVVLMEQEERPLAQELPLHPLGRALDLPLQAPAVLCRPQALREGQHQHDRLAYGKLPRPRRVH
mmetsp:Transcript_67142/g.165643  ORF Transcript_67142/g.165643 Transcript_67142/m.165643 type:complete len:344 (-) Transcript_67142:789-1820(-)